MRFSACITTRNRTQELEACLLALWSNTVKPFSVVVSDDSSSLDRQQRNAEVVQRYPGTTYVLGSQKGVCANRNHALKIALKTEPDLIAFVDDDICLEPDFIDYAIQRYCQLPLAAQSKTLLSGVHCNEPAGSVSAKLSFRGYFCPSDVPETVNLHAAVFPRALLEVEQWDETIFFGYEDAELCLRALKQGCQILFCPELQVTDTRAQESTLNIQQQERLTDYEMYIEAARLYVGIKRYKDIFPNLFKLSAFVTVYALHMTFYLLKRRSLGTWIRILQNSHIDRLWRAATPASLASSQSQNISQPN